MLISLIFAGLLQADDPVAYLRDLRDSDPEIRMLAAKLCGQKKIKTAVPRLIELLLDEKLQVRDACLDALRAITEKKDFGPDYRTWMDWWTAEGAKELPVTSLTRREVQDILDPYAQILRTEIELVKRDLRNDVDKGTKEIRMMSFFVAIIAVLFVVIMIYFVGHFSSRLKEWKDFMRQAEAMVAKGEDITQRTDKVLEELDAKKAEILEFAKKQREEMQSEIERYTDLLQKNTEHRLREEVMGLRQKAEKELEQTLGELRTQVEHEIRRGAGGHREEFAKEFETQRKKFLEEVQAHTLFLEASFYTIHGKPENAAREYKKLLAIRPDNHVAWTNLGNVYRELLRYDDALEAYQKALDLSPNEPIILYNIAAAYARGKRKDKMLDALSKAIAGDGEYKDEALNDAAFREYWHDPQFKDLAEA